MEKSNVVLRLLCPVSFRRLYPSQKVEGKGDKEGREYEGRTGLREIWKAWEENGEQQQHKKK